MSLLANLTFAAILGSGLMAGTFFAFSTFVVGALRPLPQEGGVAAMRSINARATRSPFVVVFLGMALLSVYLAAQARLHWGGIGMAYLVLGALSYLVGTFGATVIGNVPLNRKLDTEEPNLDAWNRYLVRWTLWNHLRTAASLLALWTFTMSFMDESHAYNDLQRRDHGVRPSVAPDRS